LPKSSFFPHPKSTIKKFKIPHTHPPNSSHPASSYTPSHVIKGIGYSDDEANEAIRLSWCHLTPEVDWAWVEADPKVRPRMLRNRSDDVVDDD
jgi:hypothetical protein